MMKNVQESLAGRVGIISLLPLSWAEIRRNKRSRKSFLPTSARKALNSKIDINTTFTHILRGSFPAFYRDNAPNPKRFYSSYVQTYLDRDIRDIFGIAKMETFHRFLELIAARTGQILNHSDLARDANISVPTAVEWISILENTMQIYLLRPYHSNFSKRLIKTPKLYFLDTGLAAYLTKWDSAEALRDSAMAGAFFETFVVSEIIKSYLFRGIEPPLHFFRDKEGHEIDLLIEKNQKLYPVEIKMASRITPDHARHIYYLKKRNRKVAEGAIIGLVPHSGMLEREIEILPVDAIE
jgi:predicted AAA+ superfamily ATPase